MRSEFKSVPLPNIITILQARNGSTRLPEKSMALISGKPMIQQIVQKILPSQVIHELIVATTALPQDDPIEEIATRLQCACFRGSENDCLDRYYNAALQYKGDIIVRLTGDNPLVDHTFVDWVLQQYLPEDPPCDYMDTSLSQSFPIGLSIEVFTFDALAAAWREDQNRAWREHVTPFIHQNSERFRLQQLKSPINYSHMRWTVDTKEDLQFVRSIYEYFGTSSFTWKEALAACESHPEWLVLNRHVAQRGLPT